MDGIPDKTPLTQLSIPGTHDSMAYNGNIRGTHKWMAECQDNDLKWQLNNGIRYIDIRLKLKNGNLRGYHGPAKLGTWLNDVFDILVDFLTKNPSETVIMEYQWEGVPSNSDNAYHVVLKRKMKDRFQEYLRDHVPTNYRYSKNR